MKPVIYAAVASLLLLGTIPVAWAGAAEEVAAVSQQRNPAFEKGDADAYAAAFADNAVYTSSLQLFRIEGKAAIKDFFTSPPGKA
jgi:ketosteroid isomerase-like protein